MTLIENDMKVTTITINEDATRNKVPTCKVDYRPPKSGWAPGNYMCKCFTCQATFMGDRRAVTCADCAYLSLTPRTDERELLEIRSYDMSRECGDPPYSGSGMVDFARLLESELNLLIQRFGHLHNNHTSEKCDICGLSFEHAIHAHHHQALPND